MKFIWFQGILFYIPHWIWKNWEEGKVRMISDGMRGTTASIADDKSNRQVRYQRHNLNVLSDRITDKIWEKLFRKILSKPT